MGCYLLCPQWWGLRVAHGALEATARLGLGLLGSVLSSYVLTCKHLSSGEHFQNSPHSVAPFSSGSLALEITAWSLLLPLSQ